MHKDMSSFCNYALLDRSHEDSSSTINFTPSPWSGKVASVACPGGHHLTLSTAELNIFTTVYEDSFFDHVRSDPDRISQTAISCCEADSRKDLASPRTGSLCCHSADSSPPVLELSFELSARHRDLPPQSGSEDCLPHSEPRIAAHGQGHLIAVDVEATMRIAAIDRCAFGFRSPEIIVAAIDENHARQKKERARERNKLAAMRSRERKKALMRTTMVQIQQLESFYISVQREMEYLAEERRQILIKINSHFLVCLQCRSIHPPQQQHHS